MSADSSLRWNRARWVSTALGIVLVVAVVFGIRFGGRLSSAHAQAPGGQRPAAPQRPLAPPAGSRPVGQAAPATNPQPAPVVNAPAGERGLPRDKGGAPALPSVKELKVAAVVNGEQISRQQLGEECAIRFGKEVIEGMINRQLIAQACEEQNIKITDAQIDDEIEKMATKFKLSKDRWLELLQSERGFAPEEYRREVIWPMLAMRQLVAGRMKVTDAEIQQAFESEYGPRVRVRIIAVDQEAVAKQIRAQAVADPSKFPALAKEKNQDPAVGSANGVVPPIRRHMGNKAFEDAVFKLKPNEISQPLLVGNQYIIVKCEEHLPETIVKGKDIEDANKQLAERIKEQKLRTSAGDLFKTMQAKAQVQNFIRDKHLQAQNPSAAAVVNGKPITHLQLAEECLVRHGKDVLDGEINRKLLQQELTRKQQSITPQDLDVEVARAAEMYGFLTPDNKPDISKWLKEVTKGDESTVELYRKDAVWPSVALKKLVGKAEVTEEDLKKGYESNYGEKVEVLACVFGDQRQAQKVWQMARDNPTDDFFAQLAQQYSIEPVSRSNGGKVPPIRRHSGQGKVEEEAFRMKAGELSSVIATNSQFIVMRCLGRTKPADVKFAEVKQEIFKDLEEQKLRLMMTKRFDDLKESAQIDNFVAKTTQSGRRATVTGGPKTPAGEAIRTSALPSNPPSNPPAGPTGGTPARPVSAPRK